MRKSLQKIQQFFLGRFLNLDIDIEMILILEEVLVLASSIKIHQLTWHKAQRVVINSFDD